MKDIKEIQDLLDLVNKDNQDKAQDILKKILNYESSNILNKVETIATDLHETLDNLGSDTRIFKHTKHDLPDASEQLEYVITETKKASEKTLSLSEGILASLDVLEESITDKNNKELLLRSKSELIEIMTAQSFQDLTGQVLNRVIILVSSLEQSLQDLISSAGIDIEAMDIEMTDEEKKQAEQKGLGPDIKKSNQNDIGDLLGELGI